MLLPLCHENMEGRRWPMITISLIALNVLIFLGTHWTMDAQATQEVPVRQQILVLAATYPEIQINDDDVNQWVDSLRSANRRAWEQFQSKNRILRGSVGDESAPESEMTAR